MKKYAPNIGSIQYHWSIDISTFSCVKPVVLVIGGMDDEYRSICYNIYAIFVKFLESMGKSAEI